MTSTRLCCSATGYALWAAGFRASIVQEIAVPLGRPRHAIDVDTEEFLTVKRRIRASLTA